MSTGISVVIPAYNEEDNIGPLHQEVVEVCQKLGKPFEVVIVNDGSSDDTAKVIDNLSPVVGVHFRKNFGQTAAFDAGIKQAKYSLIVTMDGDGQNDPGNIPDLIECMEKNQLDVVSGWRKKRKDSFMKKFVSRGANRLRKILINDGIKDSGCSLKLYKKECFNRVSLYGEMHRFIPALLKIKGFKVGEIEVNHRPRTAGVTKYSWSRTVKGFIDMLSVWFWNKYSVRPLHLLGGMGLILMMLSFISALITFYYFLMGQGMSETAWPILTTFFGLGGLQLFVSGLIADALMKNYYETTRDQSYSIREVIVREG